MHCPICGTTNPETLVRQIPSDLDGAYSAQGIMGLAYVCNTHDTALVRRHATEALTKWRALNEKYWSLAKRIVGPTAWDKVDTFDTMAEAPRVLPPEPQVRGASAGGTPPPDLALHGMIDMSTVRPQPPTIPRIGDLRNGDVLTAEMLNALGNTISNMAVEVHQLRQLLVLATNNLDGAGRTIAQLEERIRRLEDLLSRER